MIPTGLDVETFMVCTKYVKHYQEYTILNALSRRLTMFIFMYEPRLHSISHSIYLRLYSYFNYYSLKYIRMYSYVQ